MPRQKYPLRKAPSSKVIKQQVSTKHNPMFKPFQASDLEPIDEPTADTSRPSHTAVAPVQKLEIPSMSSNINIYATKKEKSTENCFNRPDFYHRVAPAADSGTHVPNKFRRHVSYNILSTSTSSCSSNPKRTTALVHNKNGKQKMYNNADIEEYTSLTIKRRARLTTDTSTYLPNGHRFRKPSTATHKFATEGSSEDVTMPMP